MTHLHIEGNLLSRDLIGELPTPAQITSLWTTAQQNWSAFQQHSTKGTTETRNLWVIPLLTSLGYAPRYRQTPDRIQQKTFPISHYCDSDSEHSPPLHIIASDIPLETRSQNRQSAHSLLQDYLNHTEHLWGITTNGNQWRLLRNSSLMTRLSYIEIDLAGILNSDNYADFCLFVKLFQRSNLPRNLDYNCPLEQLYHRTIEEGSRVRDRLRDGVKDAIEILGTGFLEHSHNQHLAQITPYNFYRQLLLLIYRLLFLMTAEARGLLCDGTNPDRYAI